MRVTSNAVIASIGFACLAWGAVSPVQASGGGYCDGIVTITGGGSGGGIVCTPVSPCTKCIIVTTWVNGLRFRECKCEGEVSNCCRIVWVWDPGKNVHSSGAVGYCSDPHAPCPVPGACEDVPNGSQHTAACE